MWTEERKRSGVGKARRNFCTAGFPCHVTCSRPPRPHPACSGLSKQVLRATERGGGAAQTQVQERGERASLPGAPGTAAHPVAQNRGLSWMWAVGEGTQGTRLRTWEVMRGARRDRL